MEEDDDAHFSPFDYRVADMAFFQENNCGKKQ
jgi:hypothetical protein